MKGGLSRRIRGPRRPRPAALGCALALALAGGATLAPQPASAANAFVFGCDHVHSAKDDPITHPGMPSRAPHRHDFLGNRTTNALSTRASLLAGTTSCVVYGSAAVDLSAYWVPSLWQRQLDGRFVAVPAYQATIYYRSGIDQAQRVQPFPAGLKVIAGNAHARTAQPTTVVLWGCYGETAVDANTRPWCVDNPADPGPADGMFAKIDFPSCWNGTGLDSPDHKAHMAYPVRAPSGELVCPATHPVAVPKLELIVKYRSGGGPNADDPLTGQVPGAVRLDSGGHFSMHADFFEAWNQVELEKLVQRCIRDDATGC